MNRIQSCAILLITLAATAVGCSAGETEVVHVIGISSTKSEIEKEKEIYMPDTVQATQEPPGSSLELVQINPNNIEEINEIARISPVFPEYSQISQDGKRAARGDLEGIEVIEIESGEVLTRITVDLPDCEYGMIRYFRLNADGSFIGIVTEENIQVWQVGGGVIYESSYSRQYGTDEYTCGRDLPEIALSPDGKILAVNGIEYTSSSAKQYFQIIDILENKVTFEWGGEDELAHGNLYTFPGLGFSRDGKMLQTFDPTRFIRGSGNTYLAFRFWSVEDWQEIKRDTAVIRDSFPNEDLVYSLTEENVLEIRKRISGKLITSFPVEGCTYNFPCETKFSTGTNQLAVIKPSLSRISYKNHVIASEVEIWDVLEKEKVDTLEGLFRNLDGFAFDENHKPVYIGVNNQLSSEEKTWWTNKEEFSGLINTSNEVLYFQPTAIGLEDCGDCQFCGVCEYTAASKSVHCSDMSLSFEGNNVSFAVEQGNLVLMQYEGGKQTEAMAFTFLENTKSNQRLRLLGFSDQYLTAFFCVDADYREQNCMVYDFEREQIVFESRDISFLRISPEGRRAAFIDADAHKLYIADLKEKTITKKTSFQSRAYPVNPQFMNEGLLLVYLVQNLKNASNLSFDIVDMTSEKVLGRISVDEIDGRQPTAFAASLDSLIWVVGDMDGSVKLFNAADGNLIQSWQAHKDAVIGLSFAEEGRQFITLGENGIIKVWGIVK